MSKISNFIQSLSLDITLGAVISCLFFGRLMEVDLSVHILLGLGIAIWLVYSVDHLLDAKRSSKDSSNKRHAFYAKYFRQMVVITLLVFVLGIINLWFLPTKTILYGSGLALICMAYLWYAYRFENPVNKELLAAVVYTVGVLVGPFSLVDSISLVTILNGIVFFGLAYANLLLIALFEQDEDIADQVSSVVIRKNPIQIRRIVVVVLMSALVLINLNSFSNEARAAYYIFLGMDLVLLALLLDLPLFKKNKLYRVLCDGIFFLPIFYLL